MAKNTKQTTVHIDETLLKEVKRIGINENKSISQIINESIIDYILVYRENEDKEKNEHDKNLNETINEFKKEEEKRMQAKSAARAIAEAKKRVLYTAYRRQRQMCIRDRYYIEQCECLEVKLLYEKLYRIIKRYQYKW